MGDSQSPVVLLIERALILSGMVFFKATPSFNPPIGQEEAFSFLVKFVDRSKTKTLPSSEKEIDEGLTMFGFCATTSTLNPSRTAMPLSAGLNSP